MFLDKSFKDNILTLTINRPERGNALGPSIAKELSEAMAEISNSFKTEFPYRTVVLKANPYKENGKCTWIAGGDLIELVELTKPADGRAYAGAISAFCDSLQRLPVPVIVAVNGAAIGGGAELTLAGDIRIATSSSSLVFKQLRVGLACGYGGAKRLMDLVGRGHAERLLYLDNKVSATEAKELGLFHRIAKDEVDLGKMTADICKEMASLEPLAFKAQKEMFLQGERTELDIFSELWMNDTYKKFLKKFAKNRDSQ